jgi:Ca-activated chloride channel family protein
LLDAIYLGVTQLRTAKNPRRAILILSDGGNNWSRHSEREITRLLAESDLEMYAVDMSPSSLSRGRSPEETAGPGLLEELCGQAGGRYFAVENPKQLDADALQISRELRSQYVLGYTPLNRNQDGRYRRVQLRVSPLPGETRFSVYSRRGYRAPQRGLAPID